MNYIVYKTTNKINGKVYVGVHKTETPDIFDGYLGCGCYTNKPSTWNQKTNSIFPLAIIKYGVENFKREILFIYDGTLQGRELAYKKEEEIVNDEWINSDMTYNLIKGGLHSREEQCLQKIKQFDLEGNFIKTWNSIKDAEMYYNCQGAISKCVRGINKTAKEFQWRYYNEHMTSIDSINLQKKSVYQFDLTGNLIKTWKSVREASKQFDNFDSANSSIKRNCEGLTKQALGYFWSYKKRFAYKVNTKEIAVACYSLEGKFIQSYSSVYDACEQLQINDPSGILAVIFGKHKTCKNLRWRFFYGIQSNIKPLK